jgi:ribose/xylose/arabinose/galactoside ABC-type transport system permease subunit
VLTASFAMHLVPYAWGLVVKALILVVAVYLQRPKGD